jgi:primosomal protein N'
VVNKGTTTQLTVGSTVRVPWGLHGEVEGTIVELWGDPPMHVRVELHLEGEDDAEPVVVLLTPSALTAA